MRASPLLTLFCFFSLTCNAQWVKPLSKPVSYEWAHAGWDGNSGRLDIGTDTTSVIFIGDVMMHIAQIEKARSVRGYEFDSYFKNISSLLQSADIAVANMEFTLAGKPYSGYPSFSAPESYPDYAVKGGVDVFLTANNHILDKGKEGAERTMSHYRRMEAANKIKYTGCYIDSADFEKRYPLIIRHGGMVIALINFTYGTNLSVPGEFPKVSRMRHDEISEAIQRAKDSKADFIIALPHWGTEYVLTHSPLQKALADRMIGEGVDAVIGTHPHVVQDTSFKNGVPIAYSLGNAISNMSAPNTRLEMAVRLRMTKDFLGRTKMLSPEIVFLWCSLPGRLCDDFTVIPVKDFIAKRALWRDPSDYDNMVKTYARVREATGIID